VWLGPSEWWRRIARSGYEPCREITSDTPTPLWWVAIPQLSAGHLEQYLSGVGEWWVGGFCTRGNTVANYCS
jgi:hypothetical protein